MKKNVVVLDFDGLFSYPDFKARVLEPLVEQNREFLIWTFNIEKRVRQKLERMGAPELASQVRIIDAYRYEWLRTSLGEALAGFRPIEDGRFIQNLLQDPEMPPTEATVTRVLEHYQTLSALEAGERWYKYPPLLGEDNYLLVESDRSSGLVGLTRVNPRTELDIAGRGGYSIIMVPEHPESWGEFVDPPMNVTPEQVLDILAPAVLDWSGESVEQDLGREFGIFQESEGQIQTRTVGSKERF